MTRYVLLLERPSRGLDVRITVSCAVVGESRGYYGLSKTFEKEGELNVALADARVADFEMNSALTAVRSGVRSFAVITYDQAQSLGVSGTESLTPSELPFAGTVPLFRCLNGGVHSILSLPLTC
jgi:hypothetical protein